MVGQSLEKFGKDLGGVDEGEAELSAKDWVTYFHGGAKLTKAASNEVFRSGIFAEPEGDGADRFNFKDDLIGGDDELLKALVIWLEF